jgi:hypothetical protein
MVNLYKWYTYPAEVDRVLKISIDSEIDGVIEFFYIFADFLNKNCQLEREQYFF